MVDINGIDVICKIFIQLQISLLFYGDDVIELLKKRNKIKLNVS